jgi:hypothetical protein
VLRKSEVSVFIVELGDRRGGWQASLRGMYCQCDDWSARDVSVGETYLMEKKIYQAKHDAWPIGAAGELLPVRSRCAQSEDSASGAMITVSDLKSVPIRV